MMVGHFLQKELGFRYAVNVCFMPTVVLIFEKEFDLHALICIFKHALTADVPACFVCLDFNSPKVVTQEPIKCFAGCTLASQS